jgi:uncharacterized membrane protein
MADEQDNWRNWNWTKILLVVSLGLNLAIAGVVVGSVLGHRGGDRPDRFSGGGFRPYLAALPDSQREQVRTHFLGRHDEMEARRRELRRAGRQVHEAIAADPFDPAVLDLAFSRQRSVYDSIAASGHAALIEILEGMPAADRARFIENLQSYRHRTRR